MLGLSVTNPVGKTWRLAPQFGDLKTVEGGFVTKLGKFQASWEVKNGGYTLGFNVPEGTTGTLVLPCLTKGEFPSIKVDGKNVSGEMKAKIVGEGVVFTAAGGSHTIVVG